MRSITLAVAPLLLAAPAALAHAFLRSADPAVGSTVAAAPKQVQITFTEGVEPSFSSVEVRNAAGARVDKGDLHAAPGAANRLIVGLESLPPGKYKVVWHATATDTHKTQGSFSFTVEP